MRNKHKQRTVQIGQHFWLLLAAILAGNLIWRASRDQSTALTENTENSK